MAPQRATEFLMTELALIMVSAILVNNFVLVQFLGLCPFMGVSKKIETAIGLSLATTFVLTLAAMCSYLVQQYVLKPLESGVSANHQFHSGDRGGGAVHRNGG
ncbi:Ion-translocating oxidoreductase complex subunit A [Stutzerimonas stutzeri]